MSLVVLASLMSTTSADTTAEFLSVKLSPDTDMPVVVNASKGSDVLVWLRSGYGRHENEARIAAELAEYGVEVWQPALLEAHFLPALETNFDQIAADDVAQLIEHVHRQTSKRVYLLAAGRAGLLALRGATAWQSEHPRDRTLAGIVLLHPNLYFGTPEPGKEAIYHPTLRTTRLPIYIIQPTLSPGRWRVAQTAEKLVSGGSKVYVRTLPEVRDRYYLRADATPREQAELVHFASHLRKAIAQLAKTTVSAPETATQTRPAQSKPSLGRRGLNSYTADPTPPALKLAALGGGTHDLNQYRGRVVLVNFWATWCPPCVRELPSMQRLKERLAGKPFAILTVNISEDEETIRAFLREQVKIDVPILLDRDGAAMKRWKVFVFPTSFVLGPAGSILYGAYGELSWDSEPIVRTLEGLLPRG